MVAAKISLGSKLGPAHSRWGGNSRHSALLALACMALLLGCSGDGGSPTEPSAAEAELQVEAQSFTLLNSARADAGVTPRLSRAEALRSIARAHSEAMRNGDFVAHNGPGTQTLKARLRSAGITYSQAGENLARVVAIDPAGVAHQQLMASPGHRSNILSPEFTRAGVGVARSGDTFWITQIFIKP